jgi:ATP-dependent exoDNAse (exonuclease V) alpha subunit
MLELVNNTATDAGYLVRGMASSASAAQTLQQESGIESTTTARFLIVEGRRAAENAKPEKLTLVGAIDLKGNDYRSIEISVRKNPDAIVRKELWVVDEASLAGQREASSIMTMAERAGAKVVFVGDKLQINAVEAGKPFELLQRAGIAGAEMTQINRQQVADLQQAVAFAVNRENQRAFTHLADRVVEIPNKGALFDRVVSDILTKHPEDRHNALIVVPLNADRKEINDRVRSGLQERGDIEKSGIVKDVLVGAGFSDAQKRSIAYYEPNMVVRFGRDYKSLEVDRGDYGKVIDVNQRTRTITLEAADGKHIGWSPEKQTKVEVYAIEKRDIAVGDELRFTRNNKEMEVHNGTPGKVTSVSNQEITLATKGGEVTLKGSEKQHAHIDYAYATTVPGAQGKSVADTNTLITSDSGRAMGERSFYVGITRSKTDLTIYTDSKSKAMDLIVQSQDKTSAMESLKNDATEGGKTYHEGATKNNSGGRNSVAEL